MWLLHELCPGLAAKKTGECRFQLGSCALSIQAVILKQENRVVENSTSTTGSSLSGEIDRLGDRTAEGEAYILK